jgi:hypothetical protein
MVLTINETVNYRYIKESPQDHNKIILVILIVTLHEQKGMSLIRSHIKSFARALNRKSVTRENSQIQEPEHYDPIGDKYLSLLPLLARQSARYGNLK